MSVAILEKDFDVSIVDDPDVLVVETELINVVKIEDGGAQGPQGPPGTGTVAGLLSARPLTSVEGNMYAATDTDQVFIWFV